MAQRGHAVREYFLSEYRSLMSRADNKLEGLLSLIDETGIFQHSEYRIIDRRYGYVTDDNARELIAVVRYQY